MNRYTKEKIYQRCFYSVSYLEGLSSTTKNNTVFGCTTFIFDYVAYLFLQPYAMSQHLCGSSVAFIFC